MERLMSQSMYFSILLLSCMMIPLLIETNFVLNIWLGIVPNYASSFYSDFNDNMSSQYS